MALHIPCSQVALISSIQMVGHFLLPLTADSSWNSTDIFRFTLYWTLIFHIPFYAICGIYAFLNFAFPPSRRSMAAFPLETSPRIPLFPGSNQTEQWIKRPRPNVRRSRLTFALLVILAFLLLSLTGAVMGAAVVGFVLAGVYKAGGFYMSTCVYFLCARSMHILIKFIKLGPVRMGCDSEPSRASGVSGPFFRLLLCNLTRYWQDLAVCHQHHLSSCGSASLRQTSVREPKIMAPLWIRHALPCHPYTPERSVLVHRIFAFGLVPCLVSRVLLRGLTACTIVSFSEAQLPDSQRSAVAPWSAETIVQRTSAGH
jgi:hypothetical protein